jgi:hypothetical protein
MGYVARLNQPLGTGVINKLLAAIKEEVGEQDPWVAWEHIKVGAAMALTMCASLCGPEVFLLDLASLWKYHNFGRDVEINIFLSTLCLIELGLICRQQWWPTRYPSLLAAAKNIQLD